MWFASRAARTALGRMFLASFPKTEPGKIVKVDYDQVCQIIKAKQEQSKCPILIDVRPPAEIESSGGSIPTARNIPLAEVGDALKLSDDVFKGRFGFDKPSKDDDLVFYCKAGIRAMGGAEQAASLGYKSYCYSGSWLDWSSRCHK